VNRPFHVASIVEGHGDGAALPVLLRRLVPLIDPTRAVEARRPLRAGRSRLVRDGELERLVELAARQVKGEGGAVLVLLDADDDCAGGLGPELQRRAARARPDVPSAAVVAVREFEAWFLAAAPSLAGQRGLPQSLQRPKDPEARRDAKGWLQDRRVDGLAYSPTIDQPALAAVFDLVAARASAPSFDKLWRDVEQLLAATS
jgi:hypothetical protein